MKESKGNFTSFGEPEKDSSNPSCKGSCLLVKDS